MCEVIKKDTARQSPECIECKELGCPTEGMTFMCKEARCGHAIVCAGHVVRHETKHETENSCCGGGCPNCGDEEPCGR